MTLVLHLLLAAAAGAGAAADNAASPIPLNPGTKWVYEARVKWTPTASDRVSGIQSRDWRWTMEVFETVEGPIGRAAVVRGLPADIAGMDPEIPRDYAVLIEASNRLHRVHVRNKREAQSVARQFTSAKPSWPSNSSVLLDLPLVKGKRWGEEDLDTKREDGWYCWHVEGSREELIRVKGAPAPIDSRKSLVVSVAYRTNPDHELLEIVPGLGIVRFEYEHHGTVASADVRLVEFTPGTPPRKK